MQSGKIEANVDLPADWFSPPRFERTAIQNFIELLYGQRADLTAVMFAYHEFRRAYPGTDTNGATNMAGYQMLKMGEVENAIALLQQNALDYPASTERHEYWQYCAPGNKETPNQRSVTRLWNGVYRRF